MDANFKWSKYPGAQVFNISRLVLIVSKDDSRIRVFDRFADKWYLTKIKIDESIQTKLKATYGDGLVFYIYGIAIEHLLDIDHGCGNINGVRDVFHHMSEFNVVNVKLENVGANVSMPPRFA